MVGCIYLVFVLPFCSKTLLFGLLGLLARQAYSVRTFFFFSFFGRFLDMAPTGAFPTILTGEILASLFVIAALLSINEDVQIAT